MKNFQTTAPKRFLRTARVQVLKLVKKIREKEVIKTMPSAEEKEALQAFLVPLCGATAAIFFSRKFVIIVIITTIVVQTHSASETR